MKDINLAIRDVGRIKGLSALLFAGEPGVGKTHWSELAKVYFEDIREKQVKKIFFQLYKGVEKEKLLYDYHLPNMITAMTSNDSAHVIAAAHAEIALATLPLDKQTADASVALRKIAKKHNGVVTPKGEIVLHGVLYQAALASQSGPVLLILDEIDKASNEEIDVLLLDFLQNGRLSDPLFGEVIADPKNLLVLITSNEQRELNDALYRRLRYVRLPYPTPEKQLDILRSMDEESFDILGEKLVKQLIDLSMEYRAIEDIERKVVVNQVARLMSDLVVLRHDESEIKNIILQWFSPSEEDWKELVNLSAYKKFVKAVYAPR